MRKNIGHKFTVVLMAAFFAFMMILAPAAPASAISWLAKTTRFAATAGETLATGDVACILGSDGKAYKADANDSTLRPAVGVIGKGGSSGATVEIVVEGIITGMPSKTPGGRLFLSETAGSCTITAPTNAQILGWVLPNIAGGAGSTTYFIRIQMPKSAEAAY